MFQYFYHQRLRKSVAVFGTLFNNMYILRKDASGKVISQVKVPLSYAPRMKYLDRIRENPTLTDDTKVALKLPRMSFEITSITYNSERKLPKLNNYNKPLADSINNRNKFFTPAPYTLGFQLNIYSKTQDDALQLVEQILPYFNPQYTLTIKPFNDLSPDIREDVPITIQGVSFADDYEGALEDRRTIIYTLDFTMETNFYGPIDPAVIIRRTQTDVYQAIDFSDETDPQLQQINVTPNPGNAEPEDDFGFNTEIIEDFS
jgi:hypothetical protein